MIVLIETSIQEFNLIQHKKNEINTAFLLEI